MMDIVIDLTIYVLTAAFISGFLITVLTGSGRGIKILLIVLSVLFTVIVIPGFIVTRGLLIFLILQLISMLIIIFMFIIVGAVSGAGIYTLIHKKKSKILDEDLIHDYLSLVEFSEKEGITEQRALSRIKSGFYLGGIFEGNWYVHNSELTVEVS
jgi:prepilin signal peptidase PulO-like enzyme (type II secretory pathway)